MSNKINLSKMKWLMLLVICLPFIAACDKAELPAYEEAEITKVGALHRFYTGVKDALTGENIVDEKELGTDFTIDPENAVASTVLSIPAAGGKFTEDERAKVSLNNLVVYVNVSSAARITPIEDAPKFGVPANWSKEHKYSIMAANGTIKIWTVKVSLTK